MLDPKLIALDWGTTSLRAYLLGADGVILAEKAAPLGILKVPNRAFSEAFNTLCHEWLTQKPVPAIACGMIGSRQGWVEASYAACPAGFKALAGNFGWAETGHSFRLAVVPGICCENADGMPDVMRGEETQILGALGDAECGVFVLPGTHCKWVRVSEKAVQSFATYMTGELFAVLKEHSILGRLMADEQALHLPEAFKRGWEMSLYGSGALLSNLFSVRALGLFDRLAKEEASSYLSGLLIGEEVRSASAASNQSEVTLIGEERLCSLYQEVLNARGLKCIIASAGAAVRGLWQIAVSAGLIER
jgi:2-dehydro-3-deoxygalactonokinase